MGGTTPRIGQAPVLGLPDRRRSFRWTLLCRSKLGLAFQEPVTGPVEPDPDPLARGGRDRGGAAQHGERGVAWAATRMGPGTQHHRGHDRAHPSRREHSSVCQARTRAVMARVCSSTSASKSWMRRPRARRLAAVAAVSGSPSTRSRSRPQVLTRQGVVRTRSRLRRGIGSGDHQRVQLALGVGGRLDGGAASGQPDRERGPIAGGPWLGELVTAQRLAGRPDRIQGVGLGAVAAGSPPGPVQLYHLFGVGLQELGQLASGGQAPTSGQQRRFQAAPAAVDGQVRARHHQGQSFQGHAHSHRSRPGSSPNHGQSHGHSTRRHSASQEHTRWTMHPT
jgi:hypothetical protein